MRYSAVIVAAFLSAFAVPAMAQDRTPPAGSLRALNPPIDDRTSQFDGWRERAPFEGRSAYDRRSQDAIDGADRRR